MKKAGIPGTSSLPPDLARVIEPIKQNLEVIMGARPGVAEIKPLASSASLSDVISKVNEVISRLNQSG